MKAIYLLIMTVLFSVKMYAQAATKADSSILALKAYCERQTRPSALMREENVQGVLILGFKVDSNKKISDIHFLKPLTIQYDSEAIRVLRSYTKDMSLPPADYSIAVEFLITDGRKPKPIPFDKSLYPNFLFEADIIAIN